jgi:hypothetical protein
MSKVTLSLTVGEKVVKTLSAVFDGESFNSDADWNRIATWLFERNAQQKKADDRAVGLAAHAANVEANPRGIYPLNFGYRDIIESRDCIENVYSNGWGHQCSRAAKFRVFSKGANVGTYCKQHAEEKLRRGYDGDNAIALEGTGLDDYARVGNLSIWRGRYGTGPREGEYVVNTNNQKKSYDGSFVK